MTKTNLLIEQQNIFREFSQVIMATLTPTKELFEASVAMSQEPEKYHDIIKKLHKQNILLHDQPLPPKNVGPVSFSSLKPGKYEGRAAGEHMIVWGQKGAAVVYVNRDGYQITIGKSGAKNFSTASDLKRELTQDIGKIEGYTNLPKNASLVGQRVIQKLNNDPEAYTKLTKQQKLRLLNIGKKLTNADDIVVPGRTDASKSELAIMIHNRIRPIIMKYLNSSLSNILEIIENKMRGMTRKDKNIRPDEVRKMHDWFERASFIKNTIYFLQNKDVYSDEEQSTFTRMPMDHLITNAVLLAASEKFPESINIRINRPRYGATSQFPVYELSFDYDNTQELDKKRAEYQGFLNDLASGNVTELSRVMRYLRTQI